MSRFANLLKRVTTHLTQVGAGKQYADPDPPGSTDQFLHSCRGVIHVGANSGQERELYARHGLSVIWIEPIPEVYQELLVNIRDFPEQRAVNALITDVDGAEYTFHVASNAGASSSILDLHHHRDIWPQIDYVSDLRLRSSTLPSAIGAAGVYLDAFVALVIDTQGSELMVLRGAAHILSRFKWIKTEAADFEAYRKCTTVSELTEYLRQFGFCILRREQFAIRPRGGAYWDVLFGRR